MSRTLKVFSTFTGIGGFEIGIHRAARDVLGEGINHVELVGYSEIDKYAVSVFDYHFKGVKNYGDITKIDAEALPDFECLVGGFPCQAFSVAGRRHGFADTRGTLFFDLARILRAKQPRLFVFENVKGLINHDNGQTFRTIIATIDELGYDCQWQVLNSKDFGVPQNRERIIIVGHLRGTARPQVFPITSPNRAHIKTVNNARHDYDRVYDSKGIAPTINTGQRGNAQPKIITGSPTYVDGKRQMRYKLGDEAPTIRATQYKSGDNQPKVILQRPRGKNKGGVHELAPTLSSNSYEHNNHVLVQPVITPDRINKKQNGRRIKPAGEPAFTVTATDRHGVMLSKTVRAGGRGSPHGSKQNWDSYEIDGVIRRLTPLECERLQGFPDDWTRFGIAMDKYPTKHNVAISDAQRYKMCGNAVTTNVIKVVFERILTP